MSESMRPESSEFNEFYAGYIRQVPEGQALEVMRREGEATAETLDSIGEEKAAYRYAEGKWSIKEIVGHLADTERVFSYRALRIARGDETPLAGFDQDDYVERAGFDRRTFDSLRHELTSVRRASLALYGSFSGEELVLRGVASESIVSVRALLYMTVGHELHHRRVLVDRYL